MSIRQWNYFQHKISIITISALVIFSTGTLSGKGAKDYRGPMRIVEPQVRIQEVDLSWWSETDSGGTYNPRLGLPTYIGFWVEFSLYASGFDTNGLDIEITTPKNIAISGKVYLRVPKAYRWNAATTLSSGDFHWEKAIPAGYSTTGASFGFPPQEGESQVEIKIRIRGSKWKVKYGERPDKDKEGYYEGYPFSSAISDPKERERVMGPWRVELLDENCIYELHKKYQIKVEKDSAMLFDITDGKSSQLVEMEYSPYFRWLYSIRPAIQVYRLTKDGCRELGYRITLGYTDLVEHWSSVLDTIPGSVSRLGESYKDFKFYLTGEDSIEYVKLAYQLAEAWDEALADYHTGGHFMTPQRDTFFHLSGITKRLHELWQKREEIIKKAEERVKVLLLEMKVIRESIEKTEKELKAVEGQRRGSLIKGLEDDKRTLKRLLDEFEGYYRKFKRELGDKYWQEYDEIKKGGSC